MGEVGRLFEEGEYFVPEMLVAARAMQAGPHPSAAPGRGRRHLHRQGCRRHR